MRIFFGFAFFLITFSSTAQDSIYKHNWITYGLSGGMNLSNLRQPDLKLHPQARWTAGLFQHFRLIEPMGIKLTESFTQRSSVTHLPFDHYIYDYLDFTIVPRARFLNVIDFQAGVVGNLLLSKNKLPERNSEVNLIFGAELRLQHRINLEVNYQLAVEETNISTVSFRLNYILNPTKVERIRHHKVVKEKLRDDIHALNNGVLLVRLKTATNTINAYKRQGYSEKANQLEQARISDNLQIIEAFRTQYHFSRVEFFYSTDSRKVMNGDLNGIFLNDSLQHDSSIKIDSSAEWYIAEVDFLEPVTGRRWELTDNDSTDKKSMTTHYRSSDFSRTAIVVRDKNFKQLRRPFPYYVSCQSEAKKDLPTKIVNQTIKRNILIAVKELDEKLTSKLAKEMQKENNGK